MIESPVINAGISRPRLPPELCDRIIDEVAIPNRRTTALLSSLALTCRGWLPRVRYHRWEEVDELGDIYGRFHSFFILMHLVPEIAPYIRTIEVIFDEIGYDSSAEEVTVTTTPRPLVVFQRSAKGPGAPARQDAIIRKDATSEEIVHSFFSKLVNVTYLDLDSCVFTFTPRLAQYFKKLEFLQLCMISFNSWADLRGVLGEFPKLRKIFFRRTMYNTRPELHSASSNVDNPAPSLDEIGVTRHPELMSDFHRVFIAGTQRSPVIDLSVGKTTRWTQFRKMWTKRRRFMLSKHLEYEYSDVEPEDDDDALYLDRLDPRIQFHVVELIPDWERYPDTALPSMFSWLTQIKRDVRVLYIRLHIKDIGILQSDDWIRITELLQSSFRQVEWLNCAISTTTTLLSPWIEHQLQFFARRGNLCFQFAEYRDWDPGEEDMEWELLEDSDDDNIT
ncbi:hypothetical protein CERSUDRAFT_92249 [Gelatoporia subvermispora B]|uniref:F-box domain-containing protein n=1 Tax=Ceriporiopsis subvermispora (strain B) TaxID=914234 RepID=M2R5A1_CERS8|nr:hypothetical protein CERSUDRAFT_92249 [Gelatoporia subvermispora B]